MWYSLILVVVVIGLSVWQKLHLEKDLIVGSVRAFIQLIAIGYILEFIFDLNKIYYTLLVILVMSLVGAQTSYGRSKKLPGGFIIAWISIFAGALVSLGFLIAVREIEVSPRYLIPLAGIVIGNAVKAGSLSFDRARAEINNNKERIEVLLSLGAEAKAAYHTLAVSCVRSALIPTIDTLKIVGLIQLPGAMTGMILVGASPIEAVKFQIIILYMLTCSSAVTAAMIVLLSMKKFFNRYNQLDYKLIDTGI
ncbi:ABC transporter permease [candidate division KSB1 bacterium]